MESVNNDSNNNIDQVPYSDFVANLKKPGETLLSEMTAQKCDADHMAMGIAGEAGELVDCVKRFTKYNQPINMENLTEELGDLEFFIEGIRQIFGIKREDTIKHNKRKLGKRYKKLSYSDKAAKDREDKV